MTHDTFNDLLNRLVIHSAYHDESGNLYQRGSAPTGMIPILHGGIKGIGRLHRILKDMLESCELTLAQGIDTKYMVGGTITRVSLTASVHTDYNIMLDVRRTIGPSTTYDIHFLHPTHVWAYVPSPRYSALVLRNLPVIDITPIHIISGTDSPWVRGQTDGQELVRRVLSHAATIDLDLWRN